MKPVKTHVTNPGMKQVKIPVTNPGMKPVKNWKSHLLTTSGLVFL